MGYVYRSRDKEVTHSSHGPATYDAGASHDLARQLEHDRDVLRPQVALFVNERTFLPLLVPLAPATTLLNRFPDELSVMLRALGVSAAFIAK